ncbi:hypothetical protein CMUS01_13776 [Colletotrichum musicola]|uniref:Uncharacterized protein n=1 Tax=Colletotrichum musicola TaxID=2175873 RepID=A0A8H6JAE8_9PEZI|nr:hypothetical protein CMUS01_13776 [Colletotrichum musicola]
MNDTHQAPRGDTESAASLLDRDGPDLSLHFPSDADTQNTQTPKGMRRTRRSEASSTFVKLSSWWWWEICGCLLCILSSLLLIVFLTQVDQMARQDWAYMLQPNTVISIITTVGKAAMMVPIAACISQLKWAEFRRPARLSLLQNMDDASRGPWGSLVLLTRARRNRIVLVPALAFLTVAAVGFEPSAQQILDFPSRTAMVRNASAEIGMATTYTSGLIPAQERKSPPADYDMGASFATYYRLQSTMTLIFVLDPPKPAFSCPGSSCSWKPFSTLAVCGSCKNITDQVRRNCLHEKDREYEYGRKNIPMTRNCTYSFPGVDEYGVPSEYDVDGSTLSAELLYAAERNLNRSSVEYDILKIHNETKFEMNKPARFEAYTVEWHWCAKTFHNLSASQGELNGGTTTSAALQFQAEDTIDDPVSQYQEGPYLTTWNTSSSDALYKTRPTPFWRGIKDWLDGAPLEFGVPQIDDGKIYGKDAAEIIYRMDLARMVDNVASGLSGLVWSNETDNLLAEKVLGQAFVTESYIQVQWQWITVVLVEALLAAVLLVASIIAVRGDPLPKASVIALLVHGLEDWRDVEVIHPETSATLEESSEEVVVRLMDNGAGRRLFIKQTTEYM